MIWALDELRRRGRAETSLDLPAAAIRTLELKRAEPDFASDEHYHPAAFLERARRFAVHALGQAGRLRAANGRGRYSLWTGDVGTALFAAACLDGDTRYPIFDVI